MGQRRKKLCSEPNKLDRLRRFTFYMKLTYEQKLKAYKDWKSNLKSPRTIAKELHVKHSTVEYFLKSADRHSTIY